MSSIDYKYIRELAGGITLAAAIIIMMPTKCSINKAEENVPRIELIEEKPTLSVTGEGLDGHLKKLNFYDRDSDGKTVERYEKLYYMDFPAESVVLSDQYVLEREKMSQTTAKSIDSLYQSYLNGKSIPKNGETISLEGRVE